MWIVTFFIVSEYHRHISEKRFFTFYSYQETDQQARAIVIFALCNVDILKYWSEQESSLYLVYLYRRKTFFAVVHTFYFYLLTSLFFKSPQKCSIVRRIIIILHCRYLNRQKNDNEASFHQPNWIYAVCTPVYLKQYKSNH